MSGLEASDTPLSPDLLSNALDALRRNFDSVARRLRQRPEVPARPRPAAAPAAGPPVRRQDAPCTWSGTTLDKMARGGMYDQLGGGFHRYSVDAKWLVPHFEKMLYDNALLTVAYLEAWQVTRDPFYRADRRRDARLRHRGDDRPRRARSTRTQDADSEGEEGKFYVWSEKEIREVLGPELGDFACKVWGVTEARQLRGPQHPVPRTERRGGREGARAVARRLPQEAGGGEVAAVSTCGRSASGRGGTRRS